jgi:hypothetical protein
VNVRAFFNATCIWVSHCGHCGMFIGRFIWKSPHHGPNIEVVYHGLVTFYSQLLMCKWQKNIWHWRFPVKLTCMLMINSGLLAWGTNQVKGNKLNRVWKSVFIDTRPSAVRVYATQHYMTQRSLFCNHHATG